MKRARFAFAVLALIACASASDDIDKEGNTLAEFAVVPTIPGDNSHYIDGKSRYIWFPSEKGSVLVDLKQAVSQATLDEINTDASQIEFWLYTRENRDEPQILVNEDLDSVTNSNYREELNTKVIVHGWKSDGHAKINTAITNAFLHVEDCNVIVVDWSKIAEKWWYPAVVEGVPAVGTHLGKFLIWLINKAGGNWDTIHLVGHSLGAHVVGNAGRAANGRPRRVTGLDPAGPLWGDDSNVLDIQAGKYVEAIHTNGHILGLWKNIGHADFYPNGGVNQPGCAVLSTCSHSRAYELFAATVMKNHLDGTKCRSLEEVKSNLCEGMGLFMGNNVIEKFGFGLYRLTTGADFPFCNENCEPEDAA